MKIPANIFILFCLIPLFSYGQNIIILPDVSGFSGDTVEIAIEVENANPFVGFQFDLPLPNSVDYLPNSASLTSRANGHILTAMLLAGDTLRVICYSMNLLPFSGSSGAVMNWRIILAGPPGQYPLDLNNAVLADGNSQNILTAVENGQLYLIGPIAPESFDLLYPQEGAIILDTAITFDWSDALDLDPLDTLEYTFYWTMDSIWADFDSIPNIPQSNYCFSGIPPFPANQTVWWKVKVTDCYGLGNYSAQIWSFTLMSNEIYRLNRSRQTPVICEFGEIFPNPFNSSTIIAYELYQTAGVTLRIYDLQGRLVRDFVFYDQDADIYQLLWRGDDQSGFQVCSGIYVCELSFGNFRQSKIIIHIK